MADPYSTAETSWRDRLLHVANLIEHGLPAAQLPSSPADLDEGPVVTVEHRGVSPAGVLVERRSTYYSGATVHTLCLSYGDVQLHLRDNGTLADVAPAAAVYALGDALDLDRSAVAALATIFCDAGPRAWLRSLEGKDE